MISETIYSDYKTRLMEGNRSECMNIVKNLLNKNLPVRDIYVSVFQRSLYDIGALWETNKISVAVEHLCTSITEGLISLTYPHVFAAEHIGKKVVITCTPGENHQVGARIVADYFELNGWNSFFLGPNTPYDTLADYIRKNNPDLLAVSLSVFFHLNSVRDLVTNVSKEFPDLKIIVGGQGFNWGGDNAFVSLKNVQVVKNLDELDAKILKIKNNESQCK